MKIWLDGRIVPADRPAIAPVDPAVLHGYGLFEVTRAYGGVPFRLADHMERMRHSAERFGLRVPRADLGAAIRRLCRVNRAPEAYVRITLTAGGRLFVIARPLDPLPREWRERGAGVAFVPWRRDPRSPLYGHKTLNYLENVQTRQEAVRRGYAEAIFEDPQGSILEGCVSNVFHVSKGDLCTPPLGQHILPGVTRRIVLKIAARLGLHVHERRVMERDLLRADEAFITNALVEILPVIRAGRWWIGKARPGPVTRLLAMAYRSVVLTETSKQA